MSLGIVILAAGQGTRMRSAQPKVLHPLLGKPLLIYALETARSLTSFPPLLVVGHGMDAVRQAVGEGVVYVEQSEQLGTGHATLQTQTTLEGRVEEVAVIHGDMPLLTPTTLQQVAQARREQQAPVAMLTVMADDPRGFGRVVRGSGSEVLRVVEEAEATAEELAIRELNAAVYAFDAAWLWAHLPNLPRRRNGEYYLTDLITAASGAGLPVAAVTSADPDEVLGINTRVHLAEAETALRRRINRRWMEAGVTIVDPATAYIETEVTIGQDTTIWPNTHLRGRTTVGSNCLLGPNTLIADSAIGDGCKVIASVVEGALMEAGSDVGPFSHLRPGTHLAAGAHVGNFGELKNTTLGAGAKVGHMSYLGDAEVGAGANIGAGTITCNFDGQRKHRTVIGAGAFVGSDTLLVAPVRVGQGARTGAGAVVTRDIPDGALAYGIPAQVKEEKKEK